MACAVNAAENNADKKITILEKQPKPGRKLLSSGNGRCNFTNINTCKSNYNGSFSKYADTVFEKYPPEKVIGFFERLGLVSKIEQQGRAYPYSNHSSSVLDVLRFRLESLNVETVCGVEAETVRKDKGTFIISTNKDTYYAEKLVFTTGSPAGARLGGSDKGINILKKLGHSVAPLSPALCPILTESKVLPCVKGIRCAGRVALICNGEVIKEEYGEIQFTDKALSGICVFNLASHIKKGRDYSLVVSLLPGFNRKELKNLLLKRVDIFSDRPCEDIFSGLFHKKLGIALLKEAGIKPLSMPINKLNVAQTDRLAGIINNWRFPVKGLPDFGSAQIACGGIVGDEINPATMESKIIRNLYICGEAIDIDGECGGFNLQFAFASGLTAGESL